MRVRPGQGVRRQWAGGALAEACDRVGAHLVQISTDYVFDGTLDRAYHEWDGPNPQSVYGNSKAAGEREALALGAGAAVVRTSWVCGVNGANMVKTIMRLAREHPQLSFVDDQIGHPTFTADLAVALRRIAVDRRSGVHHLTNQGETSWFGFAQHVVAAMGSTRQWSLRSRHLRCNLHVQRLDQRTVVSTTRCGAVRVFQRCVTSANRSARSYRR